MSDNVMSNLLDSLEDKYKSDISPYHLAINAVELMDIDLKDGSVSELPLVFKYMKLASDDTSIPYEEYYKLLVYCTKQLISKVITNMRTVIVNVNAVIYKILDMSEIKATKIEPETYKIDVETSDLYDYVSTACNNHIKKVEDYQIKLLLKLDRLYKTICDIGPRKTKQQYINETIINIFMDIYLNINGGYKMITITTDVYNFDIPEGYVADCGKDLNELLTRLKHRIDTMKYDFNPEKILTLLSSSFFQLEGV